MNSPRIGVVLTPAIYEVIEKMADEQRRNMSTMTRIILEDYCKEHNLLPKE